MKRIYKEFILLPNKRRLAILSALCLLTAACQLWEPWLNGQFMDGLASSDGLKRLLMILGLLLGLNLLEMIIGYWSQMLQIRIQIESVSTYMQQLTEHLLHVPASKLESMNMTVISQKINNDANRVLIFGLQILTQSPLKVIELLVCSLIFCYLSIPFFVLSLACMLIYWFFFFRFSTHLEKVEQSFLEQQSRYFESFFEWMDNWLLQKFYKVPWFRKQSDTARNELMNCAFKKTQTTYLFSAAQGLIQTIPQLLLCGFGGWGVLSGKYSLGFFVSCLSYLGNWLSSMEYFMALLISWKQTKASWNRLEEIQKMPSEIICSPASSKDHLSFHDFRKAGVITLTSRGLETKNLSYQYPEGPDLSFPDLDLKRGQISVLKGDNGSGKTTLLKILAGVHGSDQQNLISYREEEKSVDSIDSYRKNRISYMPQNVFFFPVGTKWFSDITSGNPVTVDSNLPPNSLSSDDILTAMLPESYSERCMTSDFSQGEKVRLALTKVLTENKDLLLLDEPTNHLDQQTRQWLLEHIHILSRNKIVVISSHDPDLLRQADQIISLPGLPDKA